MQYFPPTPNSQGSPGEHHDLVGTADGEETSDGGSPRAKADGLRQTKSNLASPNGEREGERDLSERQYLRPDTGGVSRPSLHQGVVSR